MDTSYCRVLSSIVFLIKRKNKNEYAIKYKTTVDCFNEYGDRQKELSKRTFHFYPAHLITVAPSKLV